MQNQNAQGKLLDSWQGLSAKINPLAQSFAKQLTTVKQWGQEKIGVADVTELPQDYIHLEQRVDALFRLHNAMLRVTKTHQTPSYDYPSHLQESLVDFSRSVSDRVKATAGSGFNKEAGAGDNASTTGTQAGDTEASAPKTLSHALARASAEGAAGIGIEEPLGAALSKYSTVQERIGDGRLKMDHEITDKFYAPFNATLNNTLAQATKARRNVQSLRLQLDASKARYRSAKPEKADAARLEVEQNEDQFVNTVEEATTIMHAVLESPEPLKNLSDLVAAQLAYFKEAHEMLAELAPEIDEMQVTQEALYRNVRSD